MPYHLIRIPNLAALRLLPRYHKAADQSAVNGFILGAATICIMLIVWGEDLLGLYGTDFTQNHPVLVILCRADVGYAVSFVRAARSTCWARTSSQRAPS